MAWEHLHPLPPMVRNARDPSSANGKFLILSQSQSQNHPFPQKPVKPCERKAKLVQKQVPSPVPSPGQVPGCQEGFAEPSQRGRLSPSTLTPKPVSLPGCSPDCVLLSALCWKWLLSGHSELQPDLAGHGQAAWPMSPATHCGLCHRPLFCSSVKSAGPALLFSAGYL